MIKILSLLLVTATLSYADQRPVVIIDNVPAAIMYAEEAAPLAASTAQTEAEQIIYFSHDGSPVVKKEKGGFYRKVLGISDTQQRTIVQDFYQDSDTAFTSPVALVQDADITILSTELFDSRVAWYRPDGSLLATSRFIEGKAMLPYNFYHNGKLIAQIPIGNPPTGMLLDDAPSGSDMSAQFFYDNGKPILRLYQHDNDQNKVNIYRQDGTPLMSISANHRGKTIVAWSQKGKQIPQILVQFEYLRTLATLETLMQRVRDDLDRLFYDSDTSLQKLL